MSRSVVASLPLRQCMLPGVMAICLLLPAPGAAQAQKKKSGGSSKQKVLQLLRENTVLHKDLTYARIGSRSLKLNLALPKNAKSPTPLVIWIHGGAWAHGSKDEVSPAAALLLVGYAVAHVEYRLTGEAPFPAQIHDCKAAVRWLRANARRYNIDPDRFAAWGGSAGGHLATLLGTTSGHRELDGNVGDDTGVSSEVQVVCNYFGPLDFPAMMEASRDTTDDLKQAIEQFFGDATPEEREAIIQLASPLAHVSRGDAPTIIVHGDKDSIVPISINRSFPDALKKQGVRTEMVVIRGAGHGGKEFFERKLLLQIVAFFDRAFKGR